MAEIKGRIHSFESFGTLDGPGIRFLVFMQGCPLRCIYCHNRDTWDAGKGSLYTPEEIIDELTKYKSYIDSSGGGLTITGGEPTLQADFVCEVFKRAKELGIHTALDTSGFADLDKVKELLDYTDLILLDIKHIDEEKHKRITGVESKKCRAFAHYASSQGIPIWIRYVLLPGFTDDTEDLERTADFIKELKSVEKIEVLPYHSMGAYKWDKLGFEYELKDIREPEANEVKRAQEILSKGLNRGDN